MQESTAHVHLFQLIPQIKLLKIAGKQSARLFAASDIFSLFQRFIRVPQRLWQLICPLSLRFSIALITSSKLPAVPLVSLCVFGFMLFNESVNPKRPDETILFASVLSITDPLETSDTVIPSPEANFIISIMSSLKNGSPPLTKRLNVPTHFSNFDMAAFPSSRPSSSLSSTVVQRQHVGAFIF